MEPIRYEGRISCVETETDTRHVNITRWSATVYGDGQPPKPGIVVLVQDTRDEQLQICLRDLKATQKRVSELEQQLEAARIVLAGKK